MSLATETDPVETILLILDDNTVAADWSTAGQKPDFLERYEATEYSDKIAREQFDAIYVWSPVEGPREKFGVGSGTARQGETIQVEVWTTTSAGEANAYAADVISLVGQYVEDNQQNTTWVDIWPENVSDETAQTPARGTNHFIITVQIALETLAET